MFWILVTSLWAAMLVSPFVLLFLFLPAGRDCPRCAHETVPIHSRVLRPLHRLVALRWCMSCGWEGVARQSMLRRPMPKLEVVAEEPQEVDDDAPWRQSY